jgi:hypothetical protein
VKKHEKEEKEKIIQIEQEKLAGKGKARTLLK